jgi:transposase
MRCQKCGLKEDRDVIAVKNLTKRYYEECASAKTQNFSFYVQQPDRCGESRVPPESPPMRRGGKG